MNTLFAPVFHLGKTVKVYFSIFMLVSLHEYVFVVIVLEDPLGMMLCFVLCLLRMVMCVENASMGDAMPCVW